MEEITKPVTSEWGNDSRGDEGFKVSPTKILRRRRRSRWEVESAAVVARAPSRRRITDCAGVGTMQQALRYGLFVSEHNPYNTGEY